MEESKQSQIVCPECKGILIQLCTNKMRCLKCEKDYKKFNGIWSFLDEKANYEWKEFFEAKAASGEVTSKTVAYRSARNLSLIKKGFQYFVPSDGTKGKLILDAGCGHGHFSKDWLKANNIIGVDLSLNMLQMARKSGIKVYQSDVLRLPFAENEFDIVFSPEVIQHIESVDSFVTELLRVLKPGGILVLSSANAHSWLRRFNRSFLWPYIFRMRRTPPPLRHLYDVLKGFKQNNSRPLGVVTTYFPLGLCRFQKEVTDMDLRLASNFVVGTIKSWVREV